ncbi:MAG: SprT family zinc-dependent metalloprotease [Candidatus Krumholzibacteriia bacterium]|nr:M48 family metallopeptidase [bacterium]MCB9515446.1 M48 family metallopeptidase [Candidatus Latescibacterota bacterium]
MAAPAVSESARQVVIDGAELPYVLVRRRGRRRLTLTVEPRHGLRVLAPLRLSLREIEGFITRERDWLRERLDEAAAWEQAHPLRRFEDGETLLLLGERWTLRVREELGRSRARVERGARFEGPGTITLRLPEGLRAGERREAAAAALERWYRRLAKELLSARVAHWSAATGLAPTRLSVRDTRSRWGSCSARGHLSFNWKIVMAPPAVVDYLVVHELCHLRHLDHSPRFWTLVGRHCPDYERARRWLRRRGRELYL